MAIEIMRKISPDFAKGGGGGGGYYTDPASDAYHALSLVDLSSFLEPGRKEEEYCVAMGNAPCPGKPTVLIQQEEEMQGGGGGGGKGEGKLLDDGVEWSPGVSAWIESGSTLSLSISFDKPVIPPWEAPAKPAITVDDLVPQRQVEEVSAGEKGIQYFRDQVADLGKKIALEYMAAFKDENSTSTSSSSSSSSSSIEGGGGVLSETERINRRRTLIYKLNKTGVYKSMKESLKLAVVSVVRDYLGASGGMSKEEMASLYNELYVLLTENVHSVLHGITNSLPSKASNVDIPTEEQLAAFKALADELEVQGNVQGAAAQHQSRLAASTNPKVWYDYGCFCMRTGEHGKAEECFREVLQFDPDHVESLIILAALLVSGGVLEQAEAYAYKAMEVEASPRTWSMLALIFEDLDRSKEANNSVYMAKKLAAEKEEEAKEKSIASLDLTILLLDVSMGPLALRAMDMAVANEVALGDGLDLHLCRSRAHDINGNAEMAMSSLTEASQIDAANPKLLVMLGKHHNKVLDEPSAIAALEAALKAADGAVSLEVFLLLGQLHAACGNHALSRVRYLDACRAWPCASSWLGAGVSSFRLGLLQDAEMCLSEANVLDNHRADVWGYCALVSLEAGRQDEASEAIRLALKEGIKDPSILAELGRAFAKQAQVGEAIRLFRLSCSCGGGAECWRQLADVLKSIREFGQAEEAYAQAVSMAEAAEDEQAKVYSDLLVSCRQELGAVE